METMQQPTLPNNEDNERLFNGIRVEKLSEIKEHIGEAFTSENINVSEENVRAFISAVRDVNPIHFNKDRIKESAFSKRSEGRIFVPGLLTQSLWCNEDVIYEALKIDEDYEVTLKSTGEARFGTPVFADSDLVFKLKLKTAEDCVIESRNGVETNWKITAYTEIDGKMRIAMTTEATLIYTSLVENV
jgi:acyl dehydratase